MDTPDASVQPFVMTPNFIAEFCIRFKHSQMAEREAGLSALIGAAFDCDSPEVELIDHGADFTCGDGQVARLTVTSISVTIGAEHIEKANAIADMLSQASAEECGYEFHDVYVHVECYVSRLHASRSS